MSSGAIGLRGLDPAIFERPKSGFVLPFDRVDPNRAPGLHGRGHARPGGDRARRARSEGRHAPLEGLRRWLTRAVLVSRLGNIRADPMVPPSGRVPMNPRSYCVVTPCRDEARYARRTLDSVVGQASRPAHGSSSMTDRETRRRRSSKSMHAAIPSSGWFDARTVATASLGEASSMPSMTGLRPSICLASTTSARWTSTSTSPRAISRP